MPAALILCLIAGALSQIVPPSRAAQFAQPPRDAVPHPEPGGTSAIKGRVVAADTGNPIRRANVTLVRGLPPRTPGAGRGAAATATLVPPAGRANQPPDTLGRPRQAVTNAQGAFEFNGLQAGTYRVIASGAAHFPQDPRNGVRCEAAERAFLVRHGAVDLSCWRRDLRQGGHPVASGRRDLRPRHGRERRTARARAGLHGLFPTRQ